MKNKPIAVGDLVVVVRDCCGAYLGRTFIVEEIGHGNGDCFFCNAKFKNVSVAADRSIKTFGDRGNLWLLRWLKRIPPLEELKKSKATHKLDKRVPA